MPFDLSPCYAILVAKVIKMDGGRSQVKYTVEVRYLVWSAGCLLAAIYIAPNQPTGWSFRIHTRSLLKYFMLSWI